MFRCPNSYLHAACPYHHHLYHVQRRASSTKIIKKNTYFFIFNTLHIKPCRAPRSIWSIVTVHLTTSLKPCRRFLTCCYLLGNSGKQPMDARLHVCAVCQPSSGCLFYSVVRQRHPQRNKILSFLAASPPGSRSDCYHQSNTASWMVEERADAAQSQEKTKPKCLLWMCACNSNSTKSKRGNLEQNTVVLECCAQGTGRFFTFLVYLIAEGLSSL